MDLNQLNSLKYILKKHKYGLKILKLMTQQDIGITPLSSYLGLIKINAFTVANNPQSKDFGEAFLIVKEICKYCEIFDDETGNPIGGISSLYCTKLFQKLFQGYPNSPKSETWIAHSIKNPKARLGFLFGKLGCKKNPYLIELSMVCVNPKVKSNVAFRFLMGMFLLNAKFNYDNDVILEVANTNLERKKPYGSGNILSKKYQTFKKNIIKCKKEKDFSNYQSEESFDFAEANESEEPYSPYSTVMREYDDDSHLYHSDDSYLYHSDDSFDPYRESVEDDSEIGKQSEQNMDALFDEFASTDPLEKGKPKFFERILGCPPPQDTVMVTKAAELAERLVCNYNRWGFYHYGERGIDFECFDKSYPYEILYNDLTKYDDKVFLKRIYELMKRKRKRLKNKSDIPGRCQEAKYIDKKRAKKKETLYAH